MTGTASKTQINVTDRRMLAPAAYSEAALPSLKLARSSRLARSIGKLLFALLIFGTILVAFAPWQQSVKGSGDVIASDPLERQQTIQAPIKGRIVRFGEALFEENAHIKKGELIAEIADIDTGYMVRLEGQLSASQRQVEAAMSLLAANKRNLEAAKTIVSSVESQVTAYGLVKEQVILAADAMIASAQNKVEAEQQQLVEHEAAFAQVNADYDRQENAVRRTDRLSTEVSGGQSEAQGSRSKSREVNGICSSSRKRSVQQAKRQESEGAKGAS